MKKIIAVILAMLMLMSLSACNNDKKERKEIVIGDANQSSGIGIEPAVEEDKGVEVDEDIKPLLEAYNEFLQETFFAEIECSPEKEDTENEVYIRLFNSSEDAYKEDATPVSIISIAELIKNGYDVENYNEANLYNGKFVELECQCYLVTNFSSEQEIYDNMAKYLDESIFADVLKTNFTECDGKVYLFRGNRGYGKESLGKVLSYDVLENGDAELTVKVNYLNGLSENINLIEVSTVDGVRKIIYADTVAVFS